MQQEEALRNAQQLLNVKTEMVTNYMADPETQAIYKVKVGLKKASEAEAAVTGKISRLREDLAKAVSEMEHRQRSLSNREHLLHQNEARQVELNGDSAKLEQELEQGAGAKDKLVRDLQKQIFADPHLNELFKDTSVKKILAARLRGSDQTRKRRKLQADKKLLKMKAAAVKAESLAKQLSAKGVLSDQKLLQMEKVATDLQTSTDRAREKVEQAAAEARQKVKAEAEASCMDIMSFIGLMAGGSKRASLPLVLLTRIASLFSLLYRRLRHAC